MNKFKNLFYTLTAINTAGAAFYISELFGTTATPLTAFIALVLAIGAATGWATVLYWFVLNKQQKKVS